MTISYIKLKCPSIVILMFFNILIDCYFVILFCLIRLHTSFLFFIAAWTRYCTRRYVTARPSTISPPIAGTAIVPSAIVAQARPLHASMPINIPTTRSTDQSIINYQAIVSSPAQSPRLRRTVGLPIASDTNEHTVELNFPARNSVYTAVSPSVFITLIIWLNPPFL